MKLWMQPLGTLQTNCYILIGPNERALVIDPGLDEEILINQLQSLHVEAILLTHAHFDHIGGLEAVRQLTGAPVYVHEQEQEWLSDPGKNGSEQFAMVTDPLRCRQAEQTLSDGMQLDLAGLNIRVLHTPGHSPGSVSFYIAEEDIVIAGDTLFAGSIGRTDLPFGSGHVLLESITERLLTLPENTRVYPGHGPETTIKAEQMYNPFLNRS